MKQDVKLRHELDSFGKEWGPVVVIALMLINFWVPKRRGISRLVLQMSFLN
jgi:hypothetical protein